MKAKRRETEELEIQGSREQQIKSCPTNANPEEEKVNKIMPVRLSKETRKGSINTNRKKYLS